VTLDLRVGSGTYVRSIATALGGHCRTLRRTEVGPFSVAEASSDLASVELLEPAAALARLPDDAVARAPKDALARAGRV
jgi:tRNA pseudouridine55 synthase